MSTVDKLIKKRRKENNGETVLETPNQPPKVTTNDADQNRETEYQKYTAYSQSNSESVKFSHQYIPATMSIFNQSKIPLSCFVSPISWSSAPMQKTADKIPRCNYCRAYMNCYNQIKKNIFRCFYCSKENSLSPQYLENMQDKEQLGSTVYQSLGSENIYQDAPPQNTIIFLIDLSNASFQCKMLYYAVTVIKQILSREQYNDTQICFFTYDQVIHEYDFSGSEVKCTVLDCSITESSPRINGNYLYQIRQKLFDLLDALQQIAENNTKQGSNFFGAYTYVFEAIKHTAGKMFIFQANQYLSIQTFAQQYFKSKNQLPQQPRKSLLDTKNKQFFNKFVSHMLNTNISCSMFIFTKGYKNIRTLSDCCKLTNSELMLYQKDNQVDLMKFYYELYHFLGATYYSDVRMELIIVPGWYFTAVYGNLFRIKEFITFKYCHLQNSKKVCISFLPQETGGPPPYFGIQVITNYIYQRQHFMSVNNIIMPITTSTKKVYEGIDYQIATAGLFKTSLSALRIQDLNSVKTKLLKQTSGIWGSAMAYHNKVNNQQYQNPPNQIKSMMLSILGFFKSSHMLLDVINDTPILDKVVSQRNMLQCCNYLDLATLFSPYLFRLSSMTQEMCQEDIEFIYPEICQLKFNDVKEGIYLMDTGLVLYLFISKQYNPKQLKQLFGKEKFNKQQVPTEDMISTQTFFAGQVTTLIRVLRQQNIFYIDKKLMDGSHYILFVVDKDLIIKRIFI